VRKEWQQRAAAQGGRALDDYAKPLRAFGQSCAGLTPPQRHLLAVLAHFPPARRLPAGAVEAVWRSTLPAGASGSFAVALEALVDTSVVDTQPFDALCVRCSHGAALCRPVDCTSMV
jgi:hypothetical protein